MFYVCLKFIGILIARSTYFTRTSAPATSGRLLRVNMLCVAHADHVPEQKLLYLAAKRKRQIEAAQHPCKASRILFDLDLASPGDAASSYVTLPHVAFCANSQESMDSTCADVDAMAHVPSAITQPLTAAQKAAPQHSSMSSTVAHSHKRKAVGNACNQQHSHSVKIVAGAQGKMTGSEQPAELKVSGKPRRFRIEKAAALQNEE